MTHPTLQGFSEPKGVERERLKKQQKQQNQESMYRKTVGPLDMDTITPLQTLSESKELKKRVRSYRDKCLRTLTDYRRYVSDNDINLYHRWCKAMDGMNLIPDKWDEANAKAYMQGGTLSAGNRLWRMRYHSCLFRETLYYDLYNRCHNMVTHFDRGESWCWAEECYLYLFITPDTFMLNISIKRHTDPGVF